MRLAITFSVLFIISLQIESFAQPLVQWSKYYGGIYEDDIRVIKEASGGGYFLGGHSYSGSQDLELNKGAADLWIFKIDEKGDLLWSKSYGGSDNERAKDILELSDGSLLVLGVSGSNDGDVVKPHNSYHKDLWYMKLDPEGNLLWSKVFSTGHDCIPIKILKTKDDQLFLTGSIEGINGSNGYFDYGMLKIDDEGEIIWKKRFGGTNSDRLSDVIIMENDEFLFMGSSYSFDGDVSGNNGESDVWLAWINKEGELLWEQNYGNSNNDYASDGFVEDEAFVIVGTSGPPFGGDVLAFKMDFDKKIIWANLFGGSKPDTGHNIFPMEDDGYLIMATTFSLDGDVTVPPNPTNFAKNWFLKLNDRGRLEWEQLYGNIYSGGLFQDGIQTSDGGYAYTTLGRLWGDTPGYSIQDCWVHKLAAPDIELVESCNLATISPTLVFSNELFLKFENPTEELLDMKIYDAAGREVASYPNHDFNYSREVTLQLPRYLNNGLYFLSIRGCTTEKSVQKFIKLN